MSWCTLEAGSPVYHGIQVTQSQLWPGSRAEYEGKRVAMDPLFLGRAVSKTGLLGQLVPAESPGSEN